MPYFLWKIVTRKEEKYSSVICCSLAMTGHTSGSMTVGSVSGAWYCRVLHEEPLLKGIISWMSHPDSVMTWLKDIYAPNVKEVGREIWPKMTPGIIFHTWVSFFVHCIQKMIPMSWSLSPDITCPSIHNFFYESAGLISVRFHMQPPDNGERKFVPMIQVTWPRWLSCSNMVKTLKIFSRTASPNALKLSM